MQDLLRWLASLKGIAVEAGTQLRLELSGWPEGGLALLVLAGVAAVLFGVFWVYRRDGRNLGRGQRAVLAALRCVAVAVALLLVLEPNIVAVKREERPGHVLLLLDVSQSMGHTDTFRQEGVQPIAEAWRQLGVSDPAGQSRLDLAKHLLAHRDQHLVNELAQRNQVMAYVFGPGVEPMPRLASAEAETTATPPRVAVDLGALAAHERYTNLGGSVRTALERSREAAIAGLILITDGRRNMGPQGAEVARLIAQRRIPHTLVLGVGDPSEARFVELTRLEAPERVFQKDPFRIAARIASQGYELTGITVRLLRAAGDAEPTELVQSKTVQIGGATSEVRVDFDQLTAATAGVQTYRVEVLPPSGEPPHPERHVAHIKIEVLGEQTRVLLIAGGPSHEYRILRNALTRDKTIELRCWLTSADPNFPQDGDVSIEELPSDRKQLDESVDVFILIDPDPAKLSREFCDLASQHVLDGGAGMWWVCGEKFTLDAMRAGATTEPLADLVPVVPDLVRADRGVYGFGHAFERPWPYELTPDGADHKVTRLVDQRDENALLWLRLPGYHLAFPVKEKKPGADTLVKVTNPQWSMSQEAMPLIAAQRVGAGAVLFSGTDETYRWRSVFETSYDQFWVKGIRYLFEGRLNAGNSRLRIVVSEDQLELGESLKVTADAKNEVFQPLLADAFALRVDTPGTPSESIRLLPVEGIAGQYAATLRPAATGFYTLAPEGDVGGSVETSFQVVPAAIEKEGPVDLAELEAIASAPDAELCATPQELLAAIDRIPSMKATDTFRTPHAIWDTWITVGLLVSILAAEWWLRKRFNLL